MEVPEAFAHAEVFLNCSTAFQGTRLREIIAPGGEKIGYEIRPVYQSFVYGAGEPVSIDYWLKGDTVIVQIRLDRQLENFLFGGSSTIEE